MTIEAAPQIANSPPQPQAPSAPDVRQPATVEETGLQFSLLIDLILKTLHFAGRPTGRQLGEQLALSFSVVEELIAFLRQEQAIEIVGSAGVGEQAYEYSLTDRGRKNADEAFERSQYVGPAPVPFQLYTDVLRQQSVADIKTDPDTFLDSLSHLVLGRRVLAALGPAVNSGRSILVYGNSGNGKSAVTVAIGAMLPGTALTPYAVEVQGYIVKVFDPRLHRRAPTAEHADRRENLAGTSPSGTERRRDARWVQVLRPVVSVGGELTLHDLELRSSPRANFYIAPLQWKANSGVLIIDDFGRQMIKPQDLLNRWIVPMEQGVDHLSLPSGDTIELPFDTILIFSSNIPPGRLGDEAFFRRIRHKVEMPNPTLEEYVEILRRVCEQQGIAYSDEGAQYLITTHYEQTGREMKACHPRDIIELLLDITEFYGEQPSLTPEWLDLACTSYFVEVEDVAA